MSESRKRWVTVALGLGPSLLVVGLWISGALDRAENGVFDFAMWLRGGEELRAPPEVAIVAIDERSLEEVGRWPWPRSRVADLVRAIRRAGAEVIALDFVMPEPSHVPPGCDCGAPRLCDLPRAGVSACRLTAEDCTLAEVIAEGDDIVLGYFLEAEAKQACDPSRQSNPQAQRPHEGFDPVELQRYDLPTGVAFPHVLAQPGIDISLSCFMQGTTHHGFVTNPRDRGVFRHYHLIQRLGRDEIREDDLYLIPLALSAVARYRGALVRVEQDGLSPKVHLGLQPLPADALGRLAIDYLGKPCTIPSFSAATLLRTPLPESARRGLEGRLVFVGLEASGLVDSHPTPFAELMPGVEIHATVAHNLLANRYLHDGARQKLLSLFAILVLGPLVSRLVRRSENRLRGALAGIGVVALWPVLAYLVYLWGRWHLFFVAPVLAGALSLVGTLTYQVFWVERQRREEELKNRILELQKDRLGSFLAPSVREQVLASEEAMEPKQKLVTILFCDIRGFSGWSERKPARLVVATLNLFFDEMTRIIHAEGGTLDKYTGDGLMAFLGAPSELPDHAAKACAATLRMQTRLAELRRASTARSATHRNGVPDLSGLRVGIGLNTGKATLGPVGSRDIKNFTAIGEDVNFAARVEGLTKAFQVQNLVTRETCREAGEAFLFRPLGPQRPKGMDESKKLFELVAEAPGTPEEQKRITLFERGLEVLFEKRDLGRAGEIFREVNDRFSDGPSEFYFERVEHWRRNPAEFDTWDGVIDHTEK